MGYRGGFRGEEEVEPMAHDIMGHLPSSGIFCLSLPSDIPGSHNMRFTFVWSLESEIGDWTSTCLSLHVALGRISLTV